jgi:hypothetical protein
MLSRIDSKFRAALIKANRRSANMPASVEFQATFDRLKAILAPYAPRLVTVSDDAHTYYLDTSHIMKNKKPLFFGSVSQRKAYVSFYLMPAYAYPELLSNITPKLAKHMQGKSCFNFKQVDERLFEELAQLTDAGFQRYQAEGFV